MASCNNDDDNSLEIRDPLEVALENDEDIVAFLESHFYNYEEFENPGTDFNFRIVIDTIAGENIDKRPLMDFVTIKNITVAEIDYKLYYLIARQGVGEMPHQADRATLTFRGNLLDATRFESIEVPVRTVLSFNRANQNEPGTIRGFREMAALLKGASDSVKNPDGTITYSNDYGIGAVFMPSGLAFTFQGAGLVPAYAPIYFRIEMYDSEEMDHDGDGIASYLEDLDGDGNPFNDDTDGDRVENFNDPDDDGDGILTRFEITINEDETITFPDCDGDGTPDYLDRDICR